MQEEVDVAVVGAGPAGSSAALAAARAGARTLILDRAAFPRYKTCGGGLTGTSLRSLPAGFEVPVQQKISQVSMSLRGHRPRLREAGSAVLTLVDRAEFDDALLREAVAAGVTARPATTVTAVRQDGAGVELATSAGPVRARYVIGADGSASRVARHVGVTPGQVDLGLEVELDAATVAERWRGRAHLDWGPIAGSYAWVFPKASTLTVGVIARRGEPQRTRAYLADFLRRQGLDGLPVLTDSGHLTRCRTLDSPLARGRVLVCGDAAGLLEPWTREGISFALRSGAIAGELAAAGGDVAARYTERIESGLAPEMAAGAQFLLLFERQPALMHGLLAHTGLGWRLFRRLIQDEMTMADVWQRRRARWLAGLFTGRH